MAQFKQSIQEGGGWQEFRRVARGVKRVARGRRDEGGGRREEGGGRRVFVNKRNKK